MRRKNSRNSRWRGDAGETFASSPASISRVTRSWTYKYRFAVRRKRLRDEERWEGRVETDRGQTETYRVRSCRILLILGEDELSREQNSSWRDKQLPPLRRWHTNCFFNTDRTTVFYAQTFCLFFQPLVVYAIIARFHVASIFFAQWKLPEDVVTTKRSLCNQVPLDAFLRRV